MTRPLLLVLGAILLWSSSPVCNGALAAQQEVVDGIAAVVNGDVITFSQVRELVLPREKALRAQYTGEELAAKVKEVRVAALQDLIDRQLIIQAFAKESFQIPDIYVDNHIKTIIRENFGGDRQTFIKALNAQNFTLGEFKKLEKEKIIVQAMRGRNVQMNTIIPPTKVDEYYRTHREEFSSKERVRLRLIMIPGGEDSGKTAAQKALAEEIMAKIVKGSDFERMAQMYSEDSTRDSGGDWGWIDRNTLAEPLEKIAFNLPVGKISNIIELGGSFYILKVEEKEGGVTKPLAEVRTEIEKKLKQEESQRLQERWLASLREKAYIKTF